MSLIRLYRLVEGESDGTSPGMAKFFLLRNIYVHGQPIIRKRLVRATMDRRFVIRSFGINPREMKIDNESKRPEGPNLSTIGAWYITDGNSSVAVMEIKMPATAIGIRTGTTSEHVEPFEVGQDYDTDQVDSKTALKKGTIIFYPVGPGILPPLGIQPYRHGINVDLDDTE